MNEAPIAAKVAAGLTREQAIEVIQRQEAEDAATSAAEEKKAGKKAAKKDSE